MIPAMWYASIVALLVADMRTKALQMNEPSRCYECSGNATCSVVPTATTISCLPEMPFCATVATGPFFESTLSCIGEINKTCAFTRNDDGTIKFTCICRENLCNTAFANDIQQELIKTSTAANKTTETLSVEFFKLPRFVNVTEATLYKAVTLEFSKIKLQTLNGSQLTTLIPSVTTVKHEKFPNLINNFILPKAEALKHEAGMPSDDDEDESEGSGAYDDIKQHAAGGNPAPPSSYLPAKENKSTYIFGHFLLIILSALIGILKLM